MRGATPLGMAFVTGAAIATGNVATSAGSKDANLFVVDLKSAARRSWCFARGRRHYRRLIGKTRV